MHFLQNELVLYHTVAVCIPISRKFDDFFLIIISVKLQRKGYSSPLDLIKKIWNARLYKLQWHVRPCQTEPVLTEQTFRADKLYLVLAVVLLRVT